METTTSCEGAKSDALVKSRFCPVLSFRAWHGIQYFQVFLDTGFRRYDG